MALVFTMPDDQGNDRIVYWYSDENQLREESKLNGVTVPDAQMVPPSHEEWQQATPYLVDGEVAWQITDIDESHPDYAQIQLSRYESLGEHQFISP